MFIEHNISVAHAHGWLPALLLWYTKAASELLSHDIDSKFVYINLSIIGNTIYTVKSLLLYLLHYKLVMAFKICFR